MTEQGIGHRKTCSTCKEEFYIPEGQHRARSYCDSCQRLHRVARNSLRSGNPIPHDHRCECCDKSAEELTTHYSRHGNPISPWRLDHCHETSEFRGWLCMNCNSGLGKFYDDVGILRNAIEYIQKHRPKPVVAA